LTTPTRTRRSARPTPGTVGAHLFQVIMRKGSLFALNNSTLRMITLVSAPKETNDG